MRIFPQFFAISRQKTSKSGKILLKRPFFKPNYTILVLYSLFFGVFGTVFAQNAEPEKNFRPTEADYLKKVAITMAPGIVIGILSFLAGLIFLVLRCICGTCGKRNATRIYASGEITRTKIGMAVVTVALGGAFAVGFIGNKQLSNGISDFGAEVVLAADRALAVVAEANRLLVAAGEPPSPGIASAASAIRATAADAAQEIDSVEAKRSLILICAFAVPLGGACVSALAMLLRTGWMTWLFVILAIVSLLVNWSSFGVHLGVHRALSDICSDVDVFLASGGRSSAISDVISCVGASEALAARTSALEAVEENTDEFNNNGVGARLEIDTARLQSTNEADLLPAVAAARLNVSDTRQQIVDSAPPSTAKDSSLDTLTKIDAGLQALPVVNEIQNCVLVLEAVSRLRNVICNDVSGGVSLVYIAHAIIGVVLLPGTILGIKGVKRFSQRGDTMSPAPTKEEYQMRQHQNSGISANPDENAGNNYNNERRGYGAAYREKDSYPVSGFQESRPPNFYDENGTFASEMDANSYAFNYENDWVDDNNYNNDAQNGWNGGYYDDYSV